VVLLWYPSNEVVSVQVVDAKAGEAFELVVGEGDRPVDVFHHPTPTTPSAASTSVSRREHPSSCLPPKDAAAAVPARARRRPACYGLMDSMPGSPNALETADTAAPSSNG
jgi:hypothetical protein